MSADSLHTEYFSLSDASDLAAAVLRTPRLALLRDSSEVDRSMIATMVSELGSNIVKYARRGVLRVCREESAQAVDITIWAEDKGPGISDVALAMTDHYSTGGSLGLGLPGVRRMADDFWIRSFASSGTQVYARKRIKGRWAAGMLPTQRAMPNSALRADVSTPAAGPSVERFATGAFLRPCKGFTRGGDATVVLGCNEGLLLALVDASGHGDRAHQIAAQVCDLLTAQGSADLEGLMAMTHQHVMGTVGAALGLAFVDSARGSFSYLGVGNTRCAKIGATPWHGVSKEGVLGERLPRLIVQTGTLEPGELLLLWSDGIPEFACLPLASRHAFRDAPEIAERVVKDLGRPYDDACCLVLKWRA